MSRSRLDVEFITAQIIAILIVSLFCAAIMAFLAGWVDLTEPTTTGFAGLILSTVGAMTTQVMSHYYRKDKKPQDDSATKDAEQDTSDS